MPVENKKITKDEAIEVIAEVMYQHLVEKQEEKQLKEAS